MNKVIQILLKCTFLLILTTSCQEDLVEPVKYNKLSDLFKTLDADKLKPTIEKSTSQNQLDYMYDFNSKIKTYLVNRYPVRYKDAITVDTNDPDLFIFGLLHAMAEDMSFKDININKSANQKNVPEWLECAWDVLAARWSIQSLYNDYIALFAEGAGWSSTWPAIRNIIRRYGGWVAVVIAGYEIADNCF